MNVGIDPFSIKLSLKNLKDTVNIDGCPDPTVE